MDAYVLWHLDEYGNTVITGVFSSLTLAKAAGDSLVTTKYSSGWHESQQGERWCRFAAGRPAPADDLWLMIDLYRVDKVYSIAARVGE